MPAAVDAIGRAPVSERLLAVEEHDVNIVEPHLAGEGVNEFQKQAGGRAAVVRSHEMAARKRLGVEMTGDCDRSSARTGELHDDVLHRYVTARGFADEWVFGHLRA